MSCRKAMTAASINDAFHVNVYKAECRSAVADLIGHKSTGLVKSARAAYKENKTSANKRKLAIAIEQQKDHTELYDLLVSEMVKSGKELNYSTEIVSPTQMAEDWNLSFSKRLRGEINPITIRQGARTIKATKNLAVRLINKRNKWLKKGKIPKKAIFASPPEFVASIADRFGLVQRLIKKALTMGDRDISITSKYSVPISQAREKFTSKLISLYSDAKNKSDFNLNNITMWGMSEENNVSFRLKDSKENVLIVGESIINNTPHFKIKYEDGKIENVPVDRLNASYEDIRAAVIGLYRDELTNEIMDGQTRLIIPSVLNKKIDTIEDEAGIKPEEDADYIAAKRKIAQMAKGKGKDKSTVSENADSTGNRVGGVHTKTVVDGGKTFQYRYIMVKQGEGSNIKSETGKPTNQETYKAYLLDKVELGIGGVKVGTPINYVGKTIKLLSGEDAEMVSQDYTQTEVDRIFGKEEGKEGVWYRSTQINDFGRRLAPTSGKKYKKGDPIDGTHTKQYVNFEKLENEPSEKLMPFVWDLVTVIREQLNLVYDDAHYKARKIEAQRNKLQTRLEKKYKANGVSEEDIKKEIDKLLNIGGVESRIWTNEQGEIITSTTYAKRKSENYVPHMYSHASVRKQLMQQIKAIDIKINREKNNEDRLERLNKGKSALVEILKRLGDNTDSSGMVDLLANPYLKHITGWTNQVERRKDSGIYQEYLDHTYRNIHKNELIVEMLETIDTMQGLNRPDGTISFLTNRIKLAMGDSDTRSMTAIGFRESGYQKTADFINSLPKWMRGGVTHDAQSAERMTKWLTTPSTIRYLGAEPALGNQTQIVNQIIQVGFGSALDAYKLRKNQKDFTDKIVQNTGVLNVLNQFSDIMNVDGDPKWNDFLFFPGGTIPNPLQLNDFRNILKAGREGFIKKDNDYIDNFLIKMEMRKSGVTREAIREIQDLRELRKQIDKKKLEAARGAFFDFFGLTKEQSSELVEKRLRALMGDMAEAKIKKWVTWKLSWWFDEVGGPGKEVFTFTEGEKTLRSMTVLMALVDAQKRGILPGTYDDLLSGEGLDVMTTDLAKKIGRDAVYNTQFGMTPMYLGEGFNGLGRLIFQYKQYPTLQTIFDWQTIQKFADGNNGKIEGAARIKNALFEMSKQAWVKDKSKKYNPKSPDIDHEAIAMLRFVFTRATASLFGSLISVVPFLGRIMRSMGNTGFGMIRSGESPALGFLMRISVWSAILAMNDDDDEADSAIGEILNSFRFLLMPVLISYMLQVGMDTYETLTED